MTEKRDIGRRSFITKAVKAFIGVSLANQVNLPEAKAANLSKYFPDTDKNNEPFSEKKSVEVINQTDPKFVLESEQQVKKIKFIVDTLGIPIKEVLLLDKNNDQLKINNQYGTYLDSLNQTGAGGLTYAEPNGNSRIVMSFEPENKNLQPRLLHELSHVVKPKSGAKEQSSEVIQLYGNFENAYRRRLAQGQTDSVYVTQIVEGTKAKIATDKWGYFLSQVGMSQYQDSSVPRQEVEKALKSTTNQSFKEAGTKFLTDPNKEYMTSFDLMDSLFKAYCEKGSEALSGTGSARDDFEIKFRSLLENATKEAWADWGGYAMENPEATKDIFSEFYDCFSTILKSINGKSLEEIAPIIRDKPKETVINEAKYGATNGDVKNILKTLLNKAIDLNTDKTKLREEMVRKMKGMGWSDQKLVAASVEEMMKKPNEYRELVKNFDQ